MFYRHYKGNDYYVLGITKSGVDQNKAGKYIEATHTETGATVNVFIYDGQFNVQYEEKLVLYIDCQGQYWLRPEEMFLGNTVVDEKEVRRFTPFNPRTMIR